jgi:transposase
MENGSYTGNTYLYYSVCMQDYYLTPEQLVHLRRAHSRERNKKKADRLKAVYLLGKQWSVNDVSEALMLDDDTLRNYWLRYQDSGIVGLLHDKYSGGESKLTDLELKLLDEHLQEVVYAKASDIIHYVSTEFEVDYTLSGMTKLLHGIGYSYKKPKKVPGKANAESQAKFIEEYTAIREKMQRYDSLFFMDASHPHYQTSTAYGWMKKGVERHIKTTAGKKKLNIQGAINIDTHQVISSFDDWLTQESSLDFLAKMRGKVPKGTIYLVCDRAPYYHTERVEEYAKSMAIEMVYLPPYSPNLNPVERLWLYFQKQVLHNKYYPDFKTFTKTCKQFFANTRWHKKQLQTLVTENFEKLDIAA